MPIARQRLQQDTTLRSPRRAWFRACAVSLMLVLPAASQAQIAQALTEQSLRPRISNRVIYTATEGRQIYNERCALCHMPDGSGRGSGEGDGFPPLTGMSEWFASRQGQLYVAHAIIYGPFGSVLVGDSLYYGLMPRFGIRFNNAQMVAVIRYVAEVINKPAPGYRPITEATVAEARKLRDTMDAVSMEREQLPER